MTAALSDGLGWASCHGERVLPAGHVTAPDQLPAVLMFVLRSGVSIPILTGLPLLAAPGGAGGSRGVQVGAMRFQLGKSRVCSQFSLLPPPADGI